MGLVKLLQYLYLKLKLLTINLATFQITNYKTILQISMIILILVYLYYLKKIVKMKLKNIIKIISKKDFYLALWKK